MTVVLVDTSSFIEFLRGTDLETLPPLILGGKVLLSAVVRLELLCGVRKTGSETLDDLLSGLRQSPELPQVSTIQTLLSRARGRGLQGGLADLMVLADCMQHRAQLLSVDKRLNRLARELRIKVWKK